MKVKRESEVTQSCPTPSDPMDCSPPGSSIHGIFQASVLEWGAIAFSSLLFININKSCNMKMLIVNLPSSFCLVIKDIRQRMKSEGYIF